MSNINFCPECAAPLKIVKRIPHYDMETGDLMETEVLFRCTGSLLKCEWRRLGVRWSDYETEHQASKKSEEYNAS